MRVGLFQYCPVASVDENINKLLVRLDGEFNTMMVLPELFLMDGSDASPIGVVQIRKSLAPLLSLSNKNRLSLAGSFAVKEESKAYNLLFYMHGGDIVGKYDKKRLFR